MSNNLGDYDVRGRDIDQLFASFGRRTLGDREIWALSLASMVTPDACPGYEAYLTVVAGVDLFTPELERWGMDVARGFASAGYKGKGRKYRRTYVEGYKDEWGRYAVRDAVEWFVTGKCVGGKARGHELSVGENQYRKIRDLVRGCFDIAFAEYKLALVWALGKRRDSVFESRWGVITGEKWSGFNEDVIINVDGDEKSRQSEYQPFVTGSALTQNADTRFSRAGWVDPCHAQDGFADDPLWRP